MDVTAHKHIAVTVGRRHGVVVEPVAHQRQRGDARGDLLAGVVRRRQWRLAARSRSSRSPIVPSWPRKQSAIRRRQHSSRWAFTPQSSRTPGLVRGSSVAHSRRALRLCPCRSFARPAEPVLEQVVRLQLGEHARALPLAVTEDGGHRDLGVVSYRIDFGTPPKNAKAPNVAVAEGFRRLCRIADHEAGVRVRQVKSEEVDVALYATDDVDGFTKVCLSMPRPIAETAPWASFGRPPRARMAGRGIIRSRSRSQPRIVTRCSSYHHQPGRRYGRRWIP